MRFNVILECPKCRFWIYGDMKFKCKRCGTRWRLLKKAIRDERQYIEIIRMGDE